VQHEYYDCFLFCRSADYAAAETIYGRLTGAGFSVWWDKIYFEAGMRWHEEIERHCEASRVAPLCSRRKPRHLPCGDACEAPDVTRRVGSCRHLSQLQSKMRSHECERCTHECVRHDGLYRWSRRCLRISAGSSILGPGGAPFTMRAFLGSNRAGSTGNAS
jgi:hypothetical protein